MSTKIGKNVFHKGIYFSDTIGTDDTNLSRSLDGVLSISGSTGRTGLNSANGHLILSSSVGSTIALSGNNFSIKPGDNNAIFAGYSDYATIISNYSLSGALYNHLALAAGEFAIFSGGLREATFNNGKTLLGRESTVSAIANETEKLNVSGNISLYNAQSATIYAKRQHLILSSSAGSNVVVSGNFELLGNAATEADPTTLRVSYKDPTVAGDSRIILSSRTANDLVLLFPGTDSRTDGRVVNDAYIYTSQALHLESRGNGSNVNSAIYLGQSSLDVSYPNSFSDMVFYAAHKNSGSIERMRIDLRGNVGINTNSPQEKLDVSGNISLRGSASLYASGTHLTLSSSAGSRVTVSGNLLTTELLFASGLRSSVANSGVTRINMDEPDTKFYRYDANDATINETMRFTSGSRFGYQTLFSGSVVYANSTNRKYHISADGGNVILSGGVHISGALTSRDTFNSQASIQAGQDFRTNSGKIWAINSTLVLTSSGGSAVAISGTLDFDGGYKAYHINSVGSNLIFSSSNSIVYASSSLHALGGFATPSSILVGGNLNLNNAEVARVVAQSSHLILSCTAGSVIKMSGNADFNTNKIYNYIGSITGSDVTYVLALNDSGKVIEMSSSIGTTASLPNSHPVGWGCTIVQVNDGEVWISGAAGATIFNRQSQFRTAGKYAACTVYVSRNSGGTNAEYVLAGDTKA